MNDIIFVQFGVKLETHFRLFYFIWEVFLIDFLSKTKSQKTWKGFRVISKQLFSSFFVMLLIQCELCYCKERSNETSNPSESRFFYQNQTKNPPETLQKSNNPEFWTLELWRKNF